MAPDSVLGLTPFLAVVLAYRCGLGGAAGGEPE